MPGPKQVIVLAVVVALAAAAGCKKREQLDLPLFPDASMAASGANAVLASGTVFRAAQRTPSSLGDVRAFYDQQLVQAKGWQLVSLPTGFAVTDGNLTQNGQFGESGYATPVDATRPGGYVLVMDASNATMIDLYQYKPKP